MISGQLLCIVWFFILYFGTLYYYRKTDIFSPVKFVCFLFILRNLSYLLLIYFDEDVFPRSILTIIGVDLDDAVIKYTFVQSIAFIFLILGISIFKIKLRKKKERSFLNIKALKYTSNTILCLGIISYLVFLSNVGGISFLLGNLDNRVELQSGAYSLIFLRLIIFGLLLRLKILSLEKNYLNKVILVIFLLTYALTSSSLGGRKGTVFVILILIIAYHSFIKEIVISKIKKSRILLLAVGLSIYTFFIPVLRSPGGFDRLIEGEENIIEHVNLSELVSYFSYTYIDIFAANYYNESNKWNFSSLLTLPMNLDFSKNISQKPPVDEGVYFYNIIRYRLEFKPPTERNKMYIVSFPIENFGFGYANWLLPGVIISFFLLGLIYKIVYGIYLRSSKSPIALYLYVFVIFSFNFSSLRLIQFIYLIVNIFLVLTIYNFFKKISS